MNSRLKLNYLGAEPEEGIMWLYIEIEKHSQCLIHESDQHHAHRNL